MDGKRAMRRLEAHQEDIAALLCEARKLLGAGATDSGKAIAALRWQLVRALREYQLFKHQEIFDPLAASPDLLISNMASRMKVRCIAIGDAYAVHVQRWSDGTATNASVAYVSEARAVTDQIGNHLERERAEAAVLLSRILRTRRLGIVGRVDVPRPGAAE